MVFATGRTQGRLWSDKAAGTGGFAVFKNLYAAEQGPKLAVDLGNWSSATPEGRLTKGGASADCVAAVPYSAAAAGLEELQLSRSELESLARAAKVPLLASNLYFRDNSRPPFLAARTMTQAGGRKIGVFSLLVNSPAKPNSRKYFANYTLEKESYEAERAIGALRKEGAQLVVMLLGINPSETAGQDYFREFLSRLPLVDLVVTDEPSVKKPFKAGRTWVAAAGQAMSGAARIVLTLDDKTGRVKSVSSRNVPLDAGKYGEDPGVLKVVAGHRAATAAHFGRKVGALRQSLPLEEGGAFPAADFAADCMRRWSKSHAAIIGLDEAAAPLSSGAVTLGDLHASFPRDSSVVYVKIRGADLERALEGLYPSGITVSGLRLHLRGQALERAAAEGGPLLPGHVYRVAVPDSLASGRDNPVLSSAMEFANSRRQLREVVRWCFSREKSFGRPEGGRIMRAGAD